MFYGLTMVRLLHAVLFALPLVAFGIAQYKTDPVCEEIKRAISSSSDVFYPGNAEYDKGIYHWDSSSSESSECVVEPGSASDVGRILRIVGRTRTKFAVKSGGHAANPGFSSTPGVLIYLGRFSSVVYNPTAQTAEIGSGLIWDDVYRALEPHGVNVVGGRVTGIGVGGYALGGGYSWKSNQYGLTVHTITAYELVKPDGSVVNVTAADRDLFFALKGGMNNFGVVTKFTLKTHPQPSQVWGGLITFLPNTTAEVNAATVAFSTEVTDPKASLLMEHIYISGATIPQVQLFYDGPTPPAGIFDNFLSLPTLKQDVSTRTFLSHILNSGANDTAGARGRFDTVSLQKITPEILDVVLDEIQFWGPQLTKENGTFLIYITEPFLDRVYNQSTAETAFPSIRSPGLLPFSLCFGWTKPSQDTTFVNAIRQTKANIEAAAVQQGQTAVAKLPLYPNYALHNTPLKRIYGDNLPRLKGIQ